MNVPLSRNLARALLTATLVPVCYASYDWCLHASRATPGQNLLVLLVFGIPGLYLGACLLYRGATFRVCYKVGPEDRLFSLPWSSDKSQIALMWLASNMMLSLYYAHTAFLAGSALFLLAGTVTAAVAITLDHPRVLYSDSGYADALEEPVSAVPDEILPAHQDGIFTYSEGAVSVVKKGVTQTAAWTDITLIRAYKQDLLSIDRICVEVHTDSFQFMFDDETPGWMKFMETAGNHLPDFNSHWLFDVAFPAYQPNPTTIYERNRAALPAPEQPRRGATMN